MVQIRAAERAGKEIIGKRVFLRPLPQGELRAIVVAHGEAAGVGRGNVAIEPAVVDLFLVLIELVHQVARSHRERQIDRRTIDTERLVRQVFGKCRVGILSLPHRRQMVQYLAVVVDLRVLLLRGVGDPVRTRKQSVKIVEAAVFGVDHDDVLDLFEVGRGRSRRLWCAARQCGREQRNAIDPGRSNAASHSGRPTRPGCGGCHSSTLLPSGSRNQPKRPYSCSSISPTTRPPPRCTCPSASSRSSTIRLNMK
jgi:hypothetical protein